jgi:hypothetical protein
MLYDFKSVYLHVDWTFSGTNRFTFKLNFLTCFLVSSSIHIFASRFPQAIKQSCGFDST